MYGVDLIRSRNLIADFDHLPATVRAILAVKIPELAQDLEGAVIDNIRERFKSGSGKLEAGVFSEVREEGARIEATVGIRGVPYARAQDKGASVPAHIIRPRQAKILAFIAASGDKVFASRVFHPGGVIPATGFFSKARREKAAGISRAIKKAVIEGIRRDMRGQ